MSLTRLLVTWLLLAVLMPMNGIVRELGFRRLMPDYAAEALRVATGFAIILETAWSEMLANHEIRNERPWPLVLVALASTPWLWRGR